MLGFNRMTQTGKAKVVTIELSQHGFTNSDSRGRSTSRFNVVLDVYPDDGGSSDDPELAELSRLEAEEGAHKFGPDGEVIK